MKKLCLLSLLFISTAAMAQYGVNGESGRYNVIEFPKYYVEQANRTFSVDVTMNKKVSGYASPEDVAEHIMFDGWTKTSADKSNMKMSIEFGEFLYLSTDIVESSKDEKQKDGSVQRVYSYRVSFKYTFPIFIKTTAPEGDNKQSINASLNIAQPQTYSIDNVFKSRSAASEYMKDNKDVLIERVIVSEVSKAEAIAIRMAKAAYGFYYTTEKASYVFLDSKKNAHYESQKQADATLKELFKSSSCNEPISSEILTPIIEEYKSIIDEFNETDKKQLKAKIKMMLSVAEFYLMLDDLDTSEAWAKRVVDEYKEKDGNDVLSKIAKVRANFEKHHVTSRHFVPQAPVVEE